jgi:AAA domain
VSTPALGAMTLPDFLTYPWQPPEPVLMPWLNQGGIAELYGLRGAGKTNVTFALALAVACGTSLFSHMWVPKPRRVLYVDGEMQPAQDGPNVPQTLVCGTPPWPPRSDREKRD